MDFLLGFGVGVLVGPFAWELLKRGYKKAFKKDL